MNAEPGEDSHMALLRGINVGGKHRLSMDGLAAIFREVGCGDVRTYIQSGNVAFRADPILVSRLPGLVSSAVADAVGFHVPVLVRTAAEMEAVVAGNPFLPGAPEHTLHVVFLRDLPRPGDVEGLDPDRSRPDRFELDGREVYLCCPDGIGRSKLTTQYFDSRLDTVSTIRNWRTVLKLLELLRAV